MTFSEILWNLKKIHGASEIQKSQNLLGPPKFTIFTKIGDPLFWNSREFWSPQFVKMQEYTRFPKFTSQNTDFSPKNVDPNFWFSSKSGPHLFWNSRELWSSQRAKMQECTCFPKYSSRNSEFSRKIFTKIFSFHENLGSAFSGIPGNFRRQNN